jgi:hypothetical protein
VLSDSPGFVEWISSGPTMNSKDLNREQLDQLAEKTRDMRSYLYPMGCSAERTGTIGRLRPSREVNS